MIICLIILSDIMVELLKFEREGFDFPFYKDNISNDRWLALILGFLIPTILLFVKLPISGLVFQILMFVVPTLAFVYASKGDFSLILKKPMKKDILLIICLVILEFAYTILIVTIGNSLFGQDIFVTHSAVMSFTSVQIIAVFFQLFGEELIKFMVFIILFAVLMKYSDNRKVSIVVATVLMIIYFGLIHYNAYSGRIVQILLMQGLGSIFIVFAYLKTKNIFVSYMCHVIIDFIPIIFMLITPNLGF